MKKICIRTAIVIGSLLLFMYLVANLDSSEYARDFTLFKIGCLEFFDCEGDPDLKNVSFSNEAKKDLEKLGTYTDEVQKAEKISWDKKTKEKLIKLAKKYGLGVSFDYHSVYMGNSRQPHIEVDKTKGDVFSKEQLDNAKNNARDSLEYVLEALGIDNKYKVDDFEQTVSEYYEDIGEDGNDIREPVILRFSLEIPLDTKLKCEGLYSELTLEYNNKFEIVEGEYYLYKLIGNNKKYKLKSIKQIKYDIENNNNILVEGNGVCEKLLINKIEMVYYKYAGFGDIYNVIPHFKITSTTDEGDLTYIYMPAIKNKYMYLIN